MTFEELDDLVRTELDPNKVPYVSYERALVDRLAPDGLLFKIDDAAIARLEKIYGLLGPGDPAGIAGIAAGEQARRTKLGQNKILLWSQIGAGAAIAAALLVLFQIIK